MVDPVPGVAAPEGSVAGRLVIDPASGHCMDAGTVRFSAGCITDVVSTGGLDEDVWVIPALADAHDHSRGIPTLSYGAEDQALELWIPALAAGPAIDPGLLTTLALCKLARSAVSSVVHCHNPQDPIRAVEEALSVCAAAATVGLRLAYVVPMADSNALGYGDQISILNRIPQLHRGAVAEYWDRTPRPVADRLAEADHIAAEVAALGSPLIDVQYGPVGPQWASPELLVAIAQASAESGRRVHMHLFETQLQREWADASFPGGLLPYLDQIGFLSERLTVAHGIWLTDEELELLGSRGVTVSINTSSNLRLRSGTAPLEAMRAANVHVAFGMDGMSLDDDEDALRELRLTQLLHGGLGMEEGLSCNDALALATSNGHVACGASGHGRIEAGAPADLAVIDRAAVTADVANPNGVDATLILARARARHMKRLIVNGTTVVADGKVIAVDEAEIAAEVAGQNRNAPPSEAAHLVPLLQAALAEHYAEGGHCGGYQPSHLSLVPSPER